MPIEQQLEKIPDLDQRKIPGVDPAVAQGVFDELLAGGDAAMVALIDALHDIDDGSDYRVRFALHNMATVVASPNRQDERAMYIKAISGQLGGDRQATVKTFLVQQLQWIAGEAEIAALAALLDQEDQALFDAALAALIVIGPKSLPALRAASEQADGARRDAIDNAVTQAAAAFDRV